jgi:trans-2-enoyl-CoA reductase
MATLRSTAARPAARLLQPALPYSPRPRAFFPKPSYLPRTGLRFKSGPYGYTQAKALVFSKYGDPSDVLQSVALSTLSNLSCNL